MGRIGPLLSGATLALVVFALLLWPAAATTGWAAPVPQSTTSVSNSVNGHGNGAGANVSGSTTVLSNTGTLSGPNDSRDASMDTGNIPSVFAGEVLSAGTISWSDEVDSVASLANLKLTLSGVTLSADFVLTRASQLSGDAPTGLTLIDNLVINGASITVSGAPNQTIAIPSGTVILNEQKTTGSGITVSAIHVSLQGNNDVVLATATAGIK
jgi:hypothetical protein